MNQHLPGRHLIAVAAAVGSIGPFGMHVLLPALPAIGAHFQAATSQVQLLVSLALVAIAFGNLAVAPFSDRFGRRAVILASLWLFIAGSVAALVATSVKMLVAARIVQAFGGGAAMAVGRAAITDFFGIGRSASALAATATAVLVVPMLAPILGGFAVDAAGWRVPFALALAFGTAVLFLVVSRMEETHGGARSAGPSLETLSRYRRLLSSRDYVTHVLFSSCMMGSVTVFITSAPYVAIEVLGVRPSSYGLLFFLPAFAAFAGFFYAARRAHRHGGLAMMRIGTVLLATGTIALLGLAAAGVAHPLALFLPGMLLCAANALSSSNAMTAAILSVPDMAGTASGLLGFIQLLVAALVTQLVAEFANQTAWPLVAAIAMLTVGTVALFAQLARAPRLPDG